MVLAVIARTVALFDQNLTVGACEKLGLGAYLKEYVWAQLAEISAVLKKAFADPL